MQEKKTICPKQINIQGIRKETFPELEVLVMKGMGKRVQSSFTEETTSSSGGHKQGEKEKRWFAAKQGREELRRSPGVEAAIADYTCREGYKL